MTTESAIYLVSGFLLLVCLGVIGANVHMLVNKVNRIERVVKDLDPGADL